MPRRHRILVWMAIILGMKADDLCGRATGGVATDVLRTCRSRDSKRNLAPRTDESNSKGECPNSLERRHLSDGSMHGFASAVKKKMKIGEASRAQEFTCRRVQKSAQKTRPTNAVAHFGNENASLLTCRRHDPIHAQIFNQLSVVIGDMPDGGGYSRQPVVAPVFSVRRLQ